MFEEPLVIDDNYPDFASVRHDSPLDMADEWAAELLDQKYNQYGDRAA